MADESSLPFVIKVLEGRLATEQLMAGQPLGTISLTGEALPYQPISFGGEQRIKTTRYPGNPKGSQQVSGVTYDNTTIKGMWKAIYLGPDFPTAMRALMDKIRDTAPTIEVSWGEGVIGDTVFGSAFVYRGLLKRTKWTLDRMQDLGWEWEFEWSGTNEPVVPVVGLADQSATDDLSSMVDKINTAVMASKIFQNQTVARLYQAKDKAKAAIGNATLTMESLGNGVASVRDRLAAGASLSEGMIGNLVGLCGMAAEQGQLLTTSFQSIEPVFYNGYDRAADTMKLLLNMFQTAAYFDAARDSAVENGARYQNLTKPQVIAEIRVRAGTDCRDLANTYYGNPDEWFLIADFNGFTSSLVPVAPSGASDDPAYPVMIPRRSLGPSFDMRTRC